MLKTGVFALLFLFATTAFAEGFLDELMGEETTEETTIQSNQDVPIVQSFDIAGVSLEATYPYLKSYVFPKNEYTLIETKNTIPQAFQYNYNYVCRQQGSKTPDSIESCIQGMAEKEKTKYIESLKFRRFKTNEELEVFFTSPFSNHVVYKVIYRNDVNEVEGIGPAYLYQQDKKRRLFWDNVVLKYKKPNIAEQAIWGDPVDETAPYLQAYYGKLKLEYPRLHEEDKIKIATEADKSFQVKKYEF